MTYLYCLLQFTWGAPQNLAGLVLRCLLLRSGKGKDRGRYRRAAVTGWSSDYGMSLGMFLFLPRGEERTCEGGAEADPLLAHEYGHSVQSLILGPLYLPAVGLTSLIWARWPRLQEMRRRTGYSYYSFWTERWADRLGSRGTGGNVDEN